MTSIVLLLCVVGADDGFSWRVTETPAFSWKITEQATVVAHDAQGPGAARSPLAPGPSTTVCKCQGFREHLCLCLKAGQKCHCSRTSGSVWAVNEQGRATHKTGAKADPRREAQPARSDAPAASAIPEKFVPTKRSDGRWWWQSESSWHNTSAELVEGQEYVGPDATWVYRGGKMERKEKPMAVQIPSGGHWVKRCYGTYCRMEWVP